jgi:hypothetical protein
MPSPEMIDPAEPPHDAREEFTDILDRMRLLGDDFTAHPDDYDLIRTIADAPKEDPGLAGDVLPDEYCIQLDLPRGRTYRVAARKLAEVLGHPPAPEAG